MAVHRYFGESRLLVTDTTMRDAHQSLLAHAHERDRGSGWSLCQGAAAIALARMLGGATFDVAMRFLSEDPWERLALVRERAPNLLTQMLLGGANCVGYTKW